MQRAPSARGTPRRPCAGTPRSSRRRTGTTMNSWKSTLLSAWAPPLSTFIIGTGSTRAASPAEIAPQRQTLLGGLRVRRRERDAEDRVRAQSRLVGGPVELDQRPVESRSGRRRPGPRTAVGDLAVHAGDGPPSRPCHPSARRRRAARSPRTLPSRPPRGPPRGRARRSAARPPPRPSGCPGCRGSGGRGLCRSGSSVRSRARSAPELYRAALRRARTLPGRAWSC